MVYETEDKTRERHPVRRGKYKVHREKTAQSTHVEETTPAEEEQAVDEAVEESFPASDPPSWSPTSTSGTKKTGRH